MITIALTPTTTGAQAGRASSRPKIAGRRAASSVTPYAATANNPNMVSCALPVWSNRSSTSPNISSEVPNASAQRVIGCGIASSRRS